MWRRADWLTSGKSCILHFFASLQFCSTLELSAATINAIISNLLSLFWIVIPCTSSPLKVSERIFVFFLLLGNIENVAAVASITPSAARSLTRLLTFPDKCSTEDAIDDNWFQQISYYWFCIVYNF